jgi:hypothetical protein
MHGVSRRHANGSDLQQSPNATTNPCAPENVAVLKISTENPATLLGWDPRYHEPTS